MMTRYVVAGILGAMAMLVVQWMAWLGHLQACHLTAAEKPAPALSHAWQPDQSPELLERRIVRVRASELDERGEALSDSVRLVPSLHRQSVRLFAIENGSLAHTIGLRNGDRLLELNGRAADMNERLALPRPAEHGTSALELVLMRSGQMVSLIVLVVS